MFRLFLFLSGCALAGCMGGGGGGGAAAGRLTMTGQVVDSLGHAAANVELRVTPFDGERAHGAPVVARTALDGTFLTRVPRGNHELRIESGSVLVFQTLLALDPDDDTVDLGILRLSQEVDADQDGLADGVETEGWEILVNLLGIERRETRRVTSDPGLADTDGDGLDDREEFGSRTDPRSVDTDGDLLDDWSELYRWKSKPNHVDSDGDACPPGCLVPDPNLFDGNELRLSGTSPTLADTDGDGIEDGVEIAGGGFAPLVADLPEVTLELFGDPSVAINASVQQQDATEFMNATLQRNEDTQSETDTNTTQNVIEVSEGWNAGGSGGAMGRVPSFSANGGFQRQEREVFTNEVSSSFTQQSVQETREEFVRRMSTQTNVSFTTGTLQAAFRVRNTSNRSYRISTLSVVAFRLLPGARGGFAVIGHLFPETEFPAGVILGPGGEFIFVARNGDLPAQNVLPLLENPSALFFRISNYQVEEVDDTGAVVRDIAAIGQRVIERTAEIVIDFGDARVERYAVATNVERNPDGSTTGITMRHALEDILGIPFTTDTRFDENDDPVLDDAGNPVTAPTAIRGLAAFDETDDQTGLRTFGAWGVIGSGLQFDPDARVSFEDLVLRNGDRVTLVFVRDDDGDVLLNREEYHYGTSPFAADTDEDGLDDREEIKEGWMIRHFEGGVELPQFRRQVFPDPRFADIDDDGLTDALERDGACATDPALRDTDGDGLFDAIDPAPCDRPETNAPVPTLGLLAYYPFNGDADDADGLLPILDGTVNNPRGTRWPTADNTEDGAPVSGIHLDTDRLGVSDAAFRFHDDTETLPGYVELPHVDATLEFTIAFWVRVGPGTISNAVDSPLYLVGQHRFASFQLDANRSERILRFHVTGDGGSPTVLESTLAEDDILSTWTFVAGRVTYDSDTGRSVVSLFIRSYENVAFSPIESAEDTTRRFDNTNDNPWYVGLPLDEDGDPVPPNSSGGYFRGNIDDIRIYDRALSDHEIDLLFNERRS